MTLASLRSSFRLLVLLPFLAFTGSLSAQTAGTLSGSVLFNGAAIQGNGASTLYVNLSGVGGTYVNTSGGYSFNLIDSGSYTATVYDNGCTTSSKLAQGTYSVVGNQTTTANIDVTATAGRLQGTVFLNGSATMSNMMVDGLCGQWQTAADGTFTHYLAAGSYTGHIVNSSGSAISSFSFTITAGQTTTVNPSAQVGVLGGTVTWNGTAVSGNTVTTMLASIANVGTSAVSTSGTYSITGVEPGMQSFTLYGNNCSPSVQFATAAYTVIGGSTTTGNIEIGSATGRVSGMISVNGTVITSPKITISGACLQWQTLSTGAFLQYLLPGSYTATVAGTTATIGTFPFTITAGQTTNVGTVNFTTGGITVIPRYGGALIGSPSLAKMYAFVNSTPASSAALDPTQAEFFLTNLSPGFYTVGIYQNNCAVSSGQLGSFSTTVTGGNTSTLQAELSSTTGLVTGSATVNGVALANPQISISGMCGTWASKSDGTYFQYLPAGSYTAQVTGPSGGTLGTFSFTIVAGQTTVANFGGTTLSATSTTLTSPANPQAVGQAVKLTATVSASYTATGSVSFYDGSTLLQTVAVSGGTATYTTTSLTVGQHSLSAVYAGDSNNATSTSSTLTETIDALPVFASTAVGTAATQMPAIFTIASSTTLPSLSNTNVLTMGASGLDFTLGTGSTCTGAVSSGQTCTVNVAFTPKYPGQRMGAVNLTNSTGTVIATTYISGTGTGPLATLSPGLLSTVAGSGTQCSPPGTAACGDGASAIAGTAHLDLPIAVAVDGAGNLYFADSSSNRIRKVTAATGILSTVAGTGTRCSPTATCGDGASATATGAYLYDPTGIAVDGAGNLYIADKFDHRIRKVTAATGFLSTVAGTGTPCSPSTATCGDGVSATATGSNLNYPEGVAVDGAGNLYIADSSDHRIRKVTAATGILSTVAGTGTACSSSTATCGDGASATAIGSNLNFPSNVAVDGAGNLYIADSSDNRIRKVTAATGFLSTVAGTGTICGSTTSACGDGASATATGASFNNVFGIAVDGAGNLYIADEGDNRIRKVAAATGILSTVAGSGTSCSPVGTGVCGDGTSATATSAEFYYPYGVAVDAAGNLYIADEIDERIRKVTATAGLVFPTATAAGSADTTDGTESVLLNNIGNAPLMLTSQTENSSNFVLGNPMTGGCVSNGSVAAGDSCLIGVTFAPQTGQSGLLVGTVATTDNSLNVTGAVQNLTLSGATSTGAITIAVNQVVTTAGTASVLMGFQYGYTGTPDTGAQTITVNGSSTGVGTVSCTYKSSHASCSFMYTGSALATVNGNGYAISVSIAASGSYAPGSGTNLLFVNAATTQGGGHSGAPVSGFVATPVAGGLTKAVVPARGAAVAPAVARPVVVNGLPSIIMPADSTTDDSVETKCVGTDCKVTEK